MIVPEDLVHRACLPNERIGVNPGMSQTLRTDRNKNMCFPLGAQGRSLPTLEASKTCVRLCLKMPEHKTVLL